MAPPARFGSNEMVSKKKVFYATFFAHNKDPNCMEVLLTASSLNAAKTNAFR